MCEYSIFLPLDFSYNIADCIYFIFSFLLCSIIYLDKYRRFFNHIWAIFFLSIVVWLFLLFMLYLVCFFFCDWGMSFFIFSMFAALIFFFFFNIEFLFSCLSCIRIGHIIHHIKNFVRRQTSYLPPPYVYITFTSYIGTLLEGFFMFFSFFLAIFVYFFLLFRFMLELGLLSGTHLLLFSHACFIWGNMWEDGDCWVGYTKQRFSRRKNKKRVLWVYFFCMFLLLLLFVVFAQYFFLSIKYFLCSKTTMLVHVCILFSFAMCIYVCL